MYLLGIAQLLTCYLKEKGYKMTKKEQIQLIKEAWNCIDRVLEMKAWGNYGVDYLRLCIDEEKKHDKLRPSGTARGITIREAGQLFAVKTMVSGLVDIEKPTLKHYLHCRKSLFYGWSLVENYREELKESLKHINFNDIKSINYAELI